VDRKQLKPRRNAATLTCGVRRLVIPLANSAHSTVVAENRLVTVEKWAFVPEKGSLTVKKEGCCMGFFEFASSITGRRFPVSARRTAFRQANHSGDQSPHSTLASGRARPASVANHGPL
jgi:hypothetical protein